MRIVLSWRLDGIWRLCKYGARTACFSGRKRDSIKQTDVKTKSNILYPEICSTVLMLPASGARISCHILITAAGRQLLLSQEVLSFKHPIIYGKLKTLWKVCFFPNLTTWPNVSELPRCNIIGQLNSGCVRAVFLRFGFSDLSLTHFWRLKPLKQLAWMLKWFCWFCWSCCSLFTLNKKQRT